MRIPRLGLCLLLVLPALGQEMPPDWRQAVGQIEPAALEAHVSFLASDLLEGRDTPSPGLDIAAEYIAAQFRRAGLEPGGDDGYFQTTRWLLERRVADEIDLAFHAGDRIIRIAPRQVVLDAPEPLSLDVPVTIVDLEKAYEWPKDKLSGMAVLAVVDAGKNEDRNSQRRLIAAYRKLREAMTLAGAEVVLICDPADLLANRMRRPRLARAGESAAPGVPLIFISDAELAKLCSSAAGDDELRLSMSWTPRPAEQIGLKNVVGITRGSDPALSKTAVVLSAHYDHIGLSGEAGGDRIYNGANDNASGTASVMEVAAAVARLARKPRRSIVFVTFYGEEKGMLGAKEYMRQPPFAAAMTVAGVNLEQTGRTDSSAGTAALRANVTGFAFSTVPETLRKAGALVGVKIVGDPRHGDQYFQASDNVALADSGIPAHTLSVTYQFPDYHGVGDQWEKIDYQNMAGVTKAIAAGVLMLADSEDEPRWDCDNPKAKRYCKARPAMP